MYRGILGTFVPSALVGWSTVELVESTAPVVSGVEESNPDGSICPRFGPVSRLGSDHAVLNLDVGLVGEVGGNDGAVLNGCGHGMGPTGS